jgi:recombination protein RecA
LSYDLALGGGWPLNQWHEVIGNESSGKTVIALKTIAANQAIDPDWCAFWVAAEALPLVWAAQLGVDLSRFWVQDTNVQEEAFDAVLQVLDSKEVDCIVIDSLPALMPSMEDEQDMEAFAVGAAARLTGKFTRKGHKATKRSLDGTERPVLGLMINQWRSQIGVMHGDPRTTPGGLAKNYFFFTRTEVRRTDWLPDNKHRNGQRINTRIFKNKSAPGQRSGDIDFYFADGGPVDVGQYDTLHEIVSVGIALDVIHRRGKYYDFRDEPICVGRERLVEVLRDHDELREQVAHDVLHGRPQPPRKVRTKKPVKKVAKKRTVKRG